jgi:hypothetical protein
MNSEELKREQLFSNLLEVAYPETLYSVGTNCKDAKAARTHYTRFMTLVTVSGRMFARKTS